MRSIGTRKVIGYGAFAVAFALSLFVWMKWRPGAQIRKHVGATVAQLPLSFEVNRGQATPDARTVTERLTQAKKLQLATAYGRFPLSFEANQGQIDSRVKFLSRGSGYSLFLTPTEAVMTLKSSSREFQARAAANGFLQRRSGADLRDKPAVQETVLRMKLVGANPAPKIWGLDELSGKSNYFIGRDPKKWRRNVPTYAKVNYKHVYAGVDLVYHGTQGKLEYDFVVAPGADPGVIGLRFEGAERLQIDAQGNLVLRTAAGELRQHKPVVYQEVAGARYVVPGSYALRGWYEAGFEIGPYDPSQPLIIDPVLSYSTYLGGVGGDLGYGIAVDAAGNAYVTGSTESSNFPTTTGAYRTNFQGGVADAFVAKLNPTGTALLYSTYLGGSGWDEGYGVAVDPAGNAYVTGYTDSTNFPTTTGAFQTTYGVGGFADAFVTKLDPTGSTLAYSTYLGGNNYDEGHGIAVDAAGNAYVTGFTDSTNYPTTTGAFQTTYVGGKCEYQKISQACSDSFVSKLNPTGTALLYSTYLGGSGYEGGFGGGIIVDSAGNAYVTGVTRSVDFPTTPGAFQTIYSGGACFPAPNTMPCGDAFVTKFNPTGTALVYSSYLGGSDEDYSRGIAVDSAGNAYVTGTTFSTNFPATPSGFQTTFGGFNDTFVTKLNPTGAALLYSTYLGGSSLDESFGIAVDSAGNAYITGRTQSSDFPTTLGALKEENWGGNYDAFVTKLNPTGTAPLLYSTYLGGSGWEGGDLYPGGGIALDATGGAYVTGMTTGNFPTTPGAFQTFFAGGSDFNFFDVFVSKVVEQNVDLGVTLTPSSLAFGNQVVNTTSATTTVTLANTGTTPVSITGIAKAGADAAHFNLLGSPSGGLTCLTGASSLPAGMSCTFGVSFAPAATGAKSASIVVTSDAAGSPHSIPVSGTGTEPTISLTATQTSAIVTRGGAATFPLTVGQAGALTSAISFSCSGLPTGWSCGFNPATVPTGSGLTQVTLTVQSGSTTAQNLPRTPIGRPGIPGTTWLGFLALLMLGIYLIARRSNAARLRPAAVLGVLAFLLLVAGCGSSSIETPRSVNFTVHATAGTTSTSMPLSITVR